MRVFWFYASCLWSDQSGLMALFMVLICGVFQDLFSSPAFRLNDPIDTVLFIPAALIRSQAHILTSGVFL
jgi:hypothetical protein